MSESFDDRLAQIGAEAEAAESDQTDRPLPAHVNVTRPGRARSKVLQVRLNSDEFEALETIAAARGLPVSTVAREQLLGLIDRRNQPGSPDETVTELLDHMQATILALRNVQVHGEASGAIAGFARRPSVSDRTK